MRARSLFILVLTSCLFTPAFALQQGQLAKKEDPAAKQRAEKQKQLSQIMQLKDEQQKKELLEKYIKENPNGPHLEMAQSMLLYVLPKVDPSKAIEMADEILAKPVEPKQSGMRPSAYRSKLAAYRELKDEAAIKALTQRILETESSLGLLYQMANADKESAPKFFEKAIAEAEKTEQNGGKPLQPFPTLVDLYTAYVRVLKESGQNEQAKTYALKAIEVAEKKVAGVEKLTPEDPRSRMTSPAPAVAETYRRQMRQNYEMLADISAKLGQGEQGLAYLEKAEALARGSSPDTGFVIARTRGDLYKTMGNTEKAFENYLQAAAYQMDPKLWMTIKEISAATARSLDDVRAYVQSIRSAQAPAIRPFALKTVEGESKSYSDFKNKVTLVNFFFPT